MARPDLLFTQGGTGVYTNAGDVASTDQEARAAEFAILTLDKPGISAAPDGALRVDHSVFDEYRQRDVIACGRRAVAWARTRLDPQAKVVFHGHSEGAAVVVRMLEESALEPLATPPTVVSAVILTGTPIDSVNALVDAQVLADLPGEAGRRKLAAVRAAIAAGESAALVEEAGVGAAYLADEMADLRLEPALFAIAESRLPARFFFLHGTADPGVPAADVASFERANAERRARGAPSLDAIFRFYPGAGHGLDRRADVDARKIFDAVRNRSPLPSLAP